MENRGIARSRLREAPWRAVAWGGAVVALLTPLIAMQITDEVRWTPADFVVAGALVLAVGIPLEIVVRKTDDPAYRGGVAVALAAAFLLVWSNLAVGILGAESNPANAVYLGVLGVGIVGALVARFEPRGMARALVATAAAQAGVPVLVWRTGWGHTGSISWTDVAGVTGVTGFFVLLWLASAWLFRRAAPDRARDGGIE